MTSAAVATATIGRRSRFLAAVVIAGSGITMVAVGLVVEIGLPAGSGSSQIQWSLIQIGCFSMAATILGGILLRHAAAQAVGAVLLLCGVSGAASILLGALGDLAVRRDSASAIPFHLASVFLWPFFVVVPLTLLPMVFPSGLLPGWLWRSFAALTGVAVLTLAVATVTGDMILIGQRASAMVNPFAQPELSLVLERIGTLLAIICCLAGMTALVLRFARGSRLIRQQLALLGVAVILMVAAMMLAPMLPQEVFQASMIVAPLLVLGSIALAMLRFELYDINVVVSRVALYVALTMTLSALFIIVYAFVLALASQLPIGPNPWAAGALGAAVAVLCAEPLRRRLQGAIERRLLGERSRPLVAMARLRDSMLEHEEGAINDVICKTIAEAVRSPGVQIALFGGSAEPKPDQPEGRQRPFVVPLLYRQEQIGELRVAPRSPGEEYGPRDRDLLAQLADQAAAILYGVRRDEELAVARRDAITIAAEQRAQLGRDLHDRIGPLLAGAGLTTEALRRGLPPGSPDEQDAAMLAQRLRVAAGEIRRIAHNLQPSPLSERGLSQALCDYVESLAGADVPRIELRVDDDVLPEAVEQTSYFFVLEALSNTIRHAKASRATVVVDRQGEQLSIEVTDDGIGLGSPYVSGIGMTSMRQRVQALGGSFSVSAPPAGGTTLVARIPVTT